MLSKTLIPLGLSLSVMLSACSPTPKRPSFNKTGAGPNETEQPKEPPPLDGAKDPDQYKLTCEMPETRRGIRAWRRLSNVEIANTAVAVFGLDPDKADFGALLADIPKKAAFDTMQVPEFFIDKARLDGYVAFAQEVAKQANLGKLFPCTPGSDKCVGEKIGELGALAWRRPLSQDDTTRFVELYKALTADGGDHNEALRILIQTLVFSPNFMYRYELGVMNGNGEFELTGWEIASALSYTLWRQPPDPTLRDLAAKNMLNSSEAIATQVKRMLADPKAKAGLADFADMWLEGRAIREATKAETKFTSQAKENMNNEIRELFVSTALDGANGNYKNLLLAESIPGQATSSFVYNAQPNPQGRIPFMEPERRGVLGSAGFLASHTFSDGPNPITRGTLVARRLLCIDFGIVPDVKIPEADQNVTNKERFQQHSIEPCKNCHAAIDPFGFALENFDVNGAFRKMDAGKPITVDSTFMLDDKSVTVNSPQALAEAIANSKQGVECFVRQAFRYSYGRWEYADRKILGTAPPFQDTPQAKLDQCEISSTTADVMKDGGKLQTALISLFSSPAFRVRLNGKAQELRTKLTDFDNGSIDSGVVH